jgi:hypothetical protein
MNEKINMDLIKLDERFGYSERMVYVENMKTSAVVPLRT